MNGPLARGWCPSLRRPMETGDGLLLRVHPPNGVLSAGQARILAETAREAGNGLVEVTGRGNLQLRGLRTETWELAAERIAAAGLGGRAGDGPDRVTVVSPLAGLDPAERFDAAAAAQAIEAAAAGVAGLSPKACVVVDAHGAYRLDEVAADVRVEPGEKGLRVVVAQAMHASELARLVARALSTRQEPSRCHSGARVSENPEPTGKGNTLDVGSGFAPPARPGMTVRGTERSRRPPVGLIDVGATLALMVELPFGRCDAGLWAELVGWAERSGSGELRLSPRRGVVLPGLEPFEGVWLRGEARSRGLIVEETDPRRAVVACPGAPACGRATTPTQADAARLAQALPPELARVATIHVSGCAKGCAHPRPADLTLVGEAGVYGLVLGGSASDPTASRATLDGLLRALGQVRDRTALHRLPAEQAL